MNIGEKHTKTISVVIITKRTYTKTVSVVIITKKERPLPQSRYNAYKGHLYIYMYAVFYDDFIGIPSREKEGNDFPTYVWKAVRNA